MTRRALLSVPGLFVPKTFRFQERIVPMGNFRSRDFSLPGTFVPGEKVPGERKFWGTFVRWTYRSEELSFPGLFVPRNFVPVTILQGISYEPQTAVTTVRICFVVGLVLSVFQK